MKHEITPEKLPIWGEHIPYNTGKSKREVMKINHLPGPLQLLGALRDTFGTKIARSSTYFDTQTWRAGIRKGLEQETFSDVPTLTPYPVKGSRFAVIFSPGGGFYHKERESEGYDKARELNKRGISAFVLDYRINPYRAPVYWLDLQRAVRYVRFHADDLGVAENKIGAVGFSAGGYVTGAEALLLDDVPPQVEGYTPDAIDRVSGRPDFTGLIYPVTGFTRNPSMLSILTGADFFDAARRPSLQRHFDLKNHLDGFVPPLFLAYGDKDPLKDMLDFAFEAEKRGLPLKKMIVSGASHGFLGVKDGHERWMNEFPAWVESVCRGEER